MNTVPNSPFPYRYSGGSLTLEDPTYVERSADEDFYNGLKAGEFCYVLNSRQMGKSSLLIRTMHRLQTEGIACADIDLTVTVTEETTKEQWYWDIITELVSCFQLEINQSSWWCSHKGLTVVRRFQVFIEEVLLTQVRQNLVIFVDEIDSVQNLRFSTDDFFALIRACNKKRPAKPEDRRLTWALLGVATPYDLLQNKIYTPFNIGRAIELKGFQPDECLALEQGLARNASNPQIVLREVLKWTGGQPFLTQKLCWIVATSEPSISSGSEALRVEQLVKSRLIEDWEAKDEPPHLKPIRDRILRSKLDPEQLLKLYKHIWQRGEVAANDTPEQRELRLSGLVVKNNGKLRVYNDIYKSVFNQKWINQALEKERERRLEAIIVSNAVADPVGQALGKERDRRQRVFTVREAIALGIVLFLSLLSPLKADLFNWRIEAQARYRNQTKQLPKSASPPVLLIAINKESLERAKIKTDKVNPIDRSYLAELVKQFSKLKAKVIGLDYLLDLYSSEDQVLAESIRTAVKQQGIWFVSPSWLTKDGGRIAGNKKIVSPEWSLRGDVMVTYHPIWEFALPASYGYACNEDCPFAYVLALTHILKVIPPKPQENSSTDLLGQVNNYINQINTEYKRINLLKRPYLTLLLQPIIDFSIPPEQVYERIPAWKFRELPPDAPEFKEIERQVVIIAPGGYDRADDNFPVPGAIRYWRSTRNEQNIDQNFTGGEAHAYMIHHLLSQHRVVLISPWVMVVVAAILGKGTSLMLQNLKRQQQRKWVVVLIGTTAYGIVTLQIYISASVLIPWFLPSAIFWIFAYSVFRRKSSA